MARCRKCGAIVNSSAAFCSDCGAPIPKDDELSVKVNRTSGLTMIPIECPRCNARLDIEANRKEAFCTYCGTKFMLKDDDSINHSGKYEFG